MSLKPPRPTGPPLNALRAFEAAARHCSFVKAADELCVTPGAVAQQVKILESWTGDKLFKRLTNGIELTTLGNSVSSELHRTFDQLGQTVQKLRAASKSNEIRIATLPSIAQFWLMPLLPSIHKIVPNATISVTAIEQQPNMLRDPFDISLFFENKNNIHDGVVLIQDEIFPVCTPVYAEKIATPKCKIEPTLIHDADWVDDWDSWLSQSDELMVKDTKGPVFSLYSLAVEETLNGSGLLMAHPLLVKNFITKGKLIPPFLTRVSTNRQLVMKIPKTSSENKAVIEITKILQSNVE